MFALLALPPEPPPPCLALSGAQVWVDDGRQGTLKSNWTVVLRGDRIVASGPDSRIRASWPRAQRVSLQGGVLLPGLIEGHAHVESTGRMARNLNLTGVGSLAACLDRLRSWATDHPTGWLIGRGWDQNLWQGGAFPTAQDLDQVVAERPVLLRRVDGHASWVNSAALRRAGIDDHTPDPPGGRILRDAAGHATGVLIDKACELVQAKVPKATPLERREDLYRGMEALRKQGFTSVADMGCDEDGVAAYRELAASGRLPLRVFAYLEFSPGVQKTLRTPPARSLSFFQVQGLKLFLDGALGSRGARLIRPYADDATTQGLWVQPPEEVAPLLELTLRAGYQPAVHAIGDAANQALIRMLAASPSLRSGRFLVRSEHAQIVEAKDALAFGRLRLGASVQPMHLADDHPWTPARLGPERISEAFPWRKFLTGGAVLGFGSDAPIADPNPFLGMAAAESRQDAQGRPSGGFVPEEGLNREEALRAYTLGNARLLGQPGLGRIRRGAVADLLWVQAPFLTLSPEALRQLKPGRLWVGGREVPLP